MIGTDDRAIIKLYSGTLLQLFHVTWHIIIGQKGGVCTTYAMNPVTLRRGWDLLKYPLIHFTLFCARLLQSAVHTQLGMGGLCQIFSRLCFFLHCHDFCPIMPNFMPKYASTNSSLTVITLRNNTRFYVALEGIVFFASQKCY